MLKIDVYHGGSTCRVRLHHHPYGADERCGEECSYEATERAYGSRGDSPADYRKRAVAAVVAVLLDPAINHAEWVYLVGDQGVLPLDLS